MPNKILLRGCAPEPLIHYLKALGIMRLVAEQLAPEVRGAWTADGFLLETEKTEDELIEFFLNEYKPTPIMSPWNGGSGFYDGDDISGREAIRSSKSERLEDYREAIETALNFPEIPSVGHLTVGDLIEQIENAITNAANHESKDVKDWKSTIDATKTGLSGFRDYSEYLRKTIDELEQIKSQNTDKNQKQLFSNLLNPAKKLRTIVKKFGRSAGKDEIIKACRNRLNDKAVEWFDASVVLFDEESGEVPLLGAGGIDGKLEFARNFMSRLLSVFPELIKTEVEGKKQKDLLNNSDDSVKLEKSKQQIAKQIESEIQTSKRNLQASLFNNCSAFLENSAVGQLQPSGAGGAPNASNKPKIDSGEGMVNPWDFILGLEGTLLLASATVRQLQTGARSRASFPFTAASSTIGYGTATNSEKIRAEMWLPIWSRLTSYAEIAHIFREGRVQFSSGNRRPRNGFDFARAVAELGVDRGIEAFQRYAFIERNGQANLAVPLGGFKVKERPRASMISEFDCWFEKLRYATSDVKKTPPRFVRIAKDIEEASFKLCADGTADSLREVFLALGEAERELSNGQKFCEEKFLQPLGNLSQKWLIEINDRSEEFEIAQALVSIVEEKGQDSIRENIELVEYKSGRFVWSPDSTRAVWGAGNLAENLSQVLQRRSIDARSGGSPHPPLQSKRFASLRAITAFLDFQTDDERIEDYLFALNTINWCDIEPFTSVKKEESKHLPRVYALLKLLFLPKGELIRENGEKIKIKHEPSIVPMLRAGRIADALEIADRRLKSSGVIPLTSDLYYPESEGARLAASLLIPISQTAIGEITKLILCRTENDLD
jgi:hypothetical protein